MSPASSSTPPPYALKGGGYTGPSPVDRGRRGSTVHFLSDANGLGPLVVGVSAATPTTAKR